MNKTAISWTDFSLNPIRFRNTETGKVGWYCQKISSGCAHCYAETLNNRFGAMVRYDVPSASKGEFFLDMKMIGKLYKEKKPSKVFALDMTDIFLDLIPDWMLVVCFYAFLDNPHHTFQLLTKRPERAVNWHERFIAAQQTDEFKALAHEHQATWGKRTFTNPWGANIWMGTSVESGATTHRIETLRQVPAQTRYISAEPLLGDWGAVDLSGIHQVIIGGESGAHMWLTNDQGARVRNEARWMKMEWALGIKNQCVDQGAAVFFKQQSGIRTEMDTFMVEADGSRWKWEQYPHDLIPPRELVKAPSPFETVSPFALEQDAAGIEADQCLRHAQEWEARAYALTGFRADNAAIAAAYWYEAAARLRPALPPLPDDDLESLRARSDERIEELLRPRYTAEPTRIGGIRAWEVMNDAGDRIFDDIAEANDAIELAHMLNDHEISDPEHAKLIAQVWNVRQVAPNGDVMDVLWKTVLGTVKDRSALKKALAEVVEPDYADPFDLPANAKVISLWQPWASLMLIGAKQVETRSWSTPHRGTLVIHASKKWDKENAPFAQLEPFRSALIAAGLDPNALPLGAALGTVILDTVQKVETIRPNLSGNEIAFGDYTPGRFGWLTSRPRPFREPLPVAGEQGLRDWSSYLAKIAPTTAHLITDALGEDDAATWDTLTDPPAQTTVVNFNHVYQHWNKQTRTWDDPKYVYIGRFMPSFNLPSSMFANPFKISTDTSTNRAAAIEQYRVWIKGKLADQHEGEKYRAELEALRGKHLVCWCKSPDGDPAKSKACHGDILKELLGETVEYVEPPKPEQPSVQMNLFDMKTYA